MGRSRDFSTLAAALVLAGTAYAQTQPPPDQPTPPPADQSTPSQVNPGHDNPTGPAPNPTQEESPVTRPEAASSPHQRDVTQQPGNEAEPQTNPNPGAQATPHQKGVTRMAEAGGVSSGMAVQSESGHPLGFVVDVLPGSSGTQESGYVVIAGAAGGGATPVPYSAASSMVQEGKLVIDQTRFTHAPKVQQNQIEDPATWKSKADSYWGESGTHTGHMGSDEHMSPEQNAPQTSPPQTSPPQTSPPQTEPPR
jgi:hypothetical protein